MKYLWIIPILILASCALFNQGGLDEAIKSIEKSDLPIDVKTAMIEAMKAAWAGGDWRAVFGDIADGAVALVLGYLGVKNAPKLFGKKSASPASGTPTA